MSDNCLEMIINYQNDKLHTLNSKLSRIVQIEGSKELDSDVDWAKKLLNESSEKIRQLEDATINIKNYKEDFSKELMARIYRLFSESLRNIDKKINSLSIADKNIETNKQIDKIKLFSDDGFKSQKNLYTSITFANGQVILVYLVSGAIYKGVIGKNPQIIIDEVDNGNIIRSFSLRPQSSKKSFAAYSSGAFKIQAPQELQGKRIKDIYYPDNNTEIDTNKILTEFDESFGLFIQLAYSK